MHPRSDNNPFFVSIFSRFCDGQEIQAVAPNSLTEQGSCDILTVGHLCQVLLQLGISIGVTIGEIVVTLGLKLDLELKCVVKPACSCVFTPDVILLVFDVVADPVPLLVLLAHEHFHSIIKKRI